MNTDTLNAIREQFARDVIKSLPNGPAREAAVLTLDLSISAVIYDQLRAQAGQKSTTGARIEYASATIQPLAPGTGVSLQVGRV